MGEDGLCLGAVQCRNRAGATHAAFHWVDESGGQDDGDAGFEGWEAGCEG